MKKLVCALLLVFVSGLSLTMYDGTSSAKRNFINKEHTRNFINLEMHVYKNEKEFRKAVKKVYPDQNVSNIIGFSIWNTINNRCDVYVTEAHRESDFDTWGHEIAHCMYGRWHKQ